MGAGVGAAPAFAAEGGVLGEVPEVDALGGAWMIQEGEWRLSKYATGETLLFNLHEDPDEQKNLAADPAHAATYRDLDARLTTWIMRAMIESHHPERVYVRDLSQDPTFGREGWRRPYPRPYGNA